jgi:CHAT domain-containing protein
MDPELIFWVSRQARTPLLLTRTTAKWGLAVSASLALSGTLLAFREGNAFKVELCRLALNAAVGSRPFEGRWIGLHHARFAGSAKAAELNGAVLRYAMPSIKALQAGAPTHEALSLKGLFALLAGDYDTAAEALKAGQGSMGSAEALSDLATVYLAQAREQNEPQLFFQALAKALSAVQQAPSLREGRFNFALALEHLALRREAVKAWRAYRGLDSDSPWAEEALHHLGALAEPDLIDRWQRVSESLRKAGSLGDKAQVRQIVARSPQLARETASGAFLSDWARESLASNTDAAARSLRAARLVGIELARTSTDSTVADAVARIDAAEAAPGDPGALAALRQGHLFLQEAQQAYEKFEIASAKRSFTMAVEQLSKGRSPLRLWALAGLAGCFRREGRYDEALSLLTQLSAPRALDRYPSLAGRCAWLQGLTSFITGHWVSSLAQYRQALAGFTAAHEAGNIAIINYLLAENLEFLGVTEEAGERLYLALQGAQEIREPDLRQLVFQGAAFSEQQRGSLQTAILFQAEAVRAARRLNVPEIIAEALAARSDLYARAGDLRSAVVDIESAETLVLSASKELREQVETDISVKKWAIQRVLRPAEAVEQLTEALAAHASADYFFYLSDLHFERAQALIALGRGPEAEADLRAGIGILEERAPGARNPEIQSSFASRWTALSSKLIDLQLARNDFDGAFETAEAARSWEPVAGMQGRGLVLSPSTLASRIPAGVALFEYVVLEDRLAIWLIRRDSVLSRVQPMDPRKVTEWVQALREEAGGVRHGGGSQQAGTALHDLLIAPFEAEVQGFELVVVPAGNLLSIPFPALFSRRTSQYLVMEHALTIAPSAALYLGAVERSQGGASLSQAKFLAVGNPSRSPELSLDLSDLVHAEGEARYVASLFPGSGILIGQDATKERLAAEAGHYNALHIGAHALVSSRAPSLSSLVLAPLPVKSDSGLLFVPEIKEIPLRQMRLIVLAACDTGSPSAGAAEPSAFVRAFLAQGVPSVIASLWRVSDEPTEALFQEFYRRLRTGEPPAEALRGAQVVQLRAGPPGRVAWQAFELFEGSR